MTTTVVLTGVGRDRVGIVAELSQILFELGCNLLDSSMTLLKSEFAVILMAQLPQSISIDDLKERLCQAEDKLGMNVFVRELSSDELMEDESGLAPYILSVYGADQPGIVAGITRVLARLSVNLTDVETKKTPGEKPIFLMVLEISLPEGMSEKALKDELAEVCEKLQVEISLTSVELAEL